ncbi:YhcB family protein [Zhongshania guokunii]|uniref:Z-ring associated protein G n=1 Tax=Zhongshania guokunii TaxID=641783 RepID=A0ABV3U5D7_9GAMM
MQDITTLIAVAIICLLSGAAIGYFVLGRLKPEQQNRAALEKQFSEMQQQQQDYQQHVSSHFDRTGELLNELAESYRSVHNHIVEGAQNLHSSGISPLQALPEGRPVLESKSNKVVPSAPPLDYAPRQPGKKGALHEEFGMDSEKKPKEHIEPPVAPHL